tara:strand:- start:6769 stop:7023 length:255 start_codon:yes stop_codon:yes gene_type:complete
MKKLGERNFLLLSQGINATGSYDPNEVFFFFEEQLYVHESNTIWAFLQWVTDGGTKVLHGLKLPKRGFGRDNYEERFKEFLKQR